MPAAQEQQELNSLLDIIEMHESTGENYDPSADGFVFSESEIEGGVRARNRENQAEEAYEHRLESAA